MVFGQARDSDFELWPKEPLALGLMDKFEVPMFLSWVLALIELDSFSFGASNPAD